MPLLNESHIEQNLIELLVSQGYQYFYGPDIAPYSTNPQRERFDSVILESHLKQSLKKLQTEYVDLYLIHWPVNGLGEFKIPLF